MIKQVPTRLSMEAGVIKPLRMLDYSSELFSVEERGKGEGEQRV